LKRRAPPISRLGFPSFFAVVSWEKHRVLARKAGISRSMQCINPRVKLTAKARRSSFGSNGYEDAKVMLVLVDKGRQ
jgi:hypothetical protein